MANADGVLARAGRLRPPFRQLNGGQWMVLLVVLTGMALLGNYVVGRFIGDDAPAAPAYQVGQVGRRTISGTVNATGTVSATRQIKLTFPAAGQVKEVLVKLNEAVVEGQPLATLDTFLLEIKRDQARVTLDQAQQKLLALLNGPTNSDVATAQQSVTSAQSLLTQAQSTQYNVLAGATADEIAITRAALDRAKANLDAAQTAYEKLVTGTDLTLRPEYAALQSARSAYQNALSVYTTRTGPPNSFDVANAQAAVSSAERAVGTAQTGVSSAQAGVTTARAALESARSKLAQTVAGADPLDIANAQNQVSSAQAALESARARLVAVQVGAVQNVSALQSSVEAARLALVAANARLTAALSAEGQGLTVRAGGETAVPEVGGVPAAKQAVAQAEAALATAQTNLATATAGPNSSDVATAQAGIAAAESALRSAENNLTKLQQGASATDLVAAQQTVTTAEGGLTSALNQVTTAQNGVVTAQNALATARTNLDKILAGATPEDIAAASVALESARSALDTAETNWNRLVSGTDITSRSEYTALMTARADYQTALSNYNIRTAPPKDTDVASAQASVNSAQASVNAALARLAQVLGGSLPTDVQQARDTVSSAELALKQAQNDFDNAVIKAPFKGTIVSAPLNPGDQVTASTTAFTILDPNLIRVDATVDESNFARLKIGMPVAVTIDSLQGRSFQGTVAGLTPAGVTTQGVVTFPVQVAFNAQGTAIPTGATATLRVTTDSKPDVIAVPARAVQRQGRTSIVQVVQADGTLKDQVVTTGLTGDNFTEITSGLEEGQKIVTVPARAAGTTPTGGTLGTGGLPAAPAPGGR